MYELQLKVVLHLLVHTINQPIFSCSLWIRLGEQQASIKETLGLLELDFYGLDALLSVEQLCPHTEGKEYIEHYCTVAFVNSVKTVMVTVKIPL